MANVPGTLAKVTVPIACVWAVSAEAIRHSTVVPLVHDDVERCTSDIAAVGVVSWSAKARPLSVAVNPPEEGTFPTDTVAGLTTGAVGKMDEFRLDKFRIGEREMTGNKAERKHN